jgi:hypothetical protein
MKKEISPEINEIERRLLDALLDGDDPILNSLRIQLAEAKIESRELSGSGFFLNFPIPNSVPKVEPGGIIIGDVYFDLEGIENGGGAIIFVKNGYLSMLEAYLNSDENWPDQPHLSRLSYDSNPRDLAGLLRKPQYFGERYEAH